MKYVGLDPSYTGFGFAVLSGDTTVHTERWSWDPKAYETDTARLKDIYSDVKERVGNVHRFGGAAVAMEGYSMGSKFGREKAGELGAAVKFALFDLGIAPIVVPPTVLKKFVTGKGNAKKQEMLLGVFKRWKVEFSDDNEADAFALAQFAKATFEGADTAFQREAVAAVIGS